MNLQMLRELETNLIRQGYSRRYARRLSDELSDHYRELIASHNGAPVDSASVVTTPEKRLGSAEVLASAVRVHRELDPIPRKYPFACYVVAPGLVLTLLTIGVLYLVHDWIPAADQGGRVFAVNIWNVVYYGALALVPIIGLLVAMRYHVSTGYVILLTLILSLSSLFATTVATCNQSDSAFVHSRWDFGWWRFLLPFIALATSFLIYNGVNLVSGTKKPLLRKFGSGNSISRQKPLHLLPYALLFGLLVIGSAYWITTSLESLRRHPVDNLVNQFNGENQRIGRFLNVLRNPESSSEILRSDQLAEVNGIVALNDARLKKTYARLSASELGGETFKEVQADVTEICKDAYTRIRALISNEQTGRVHKEGLKRAGWLAMFDNDVRNEVDLSAYQFRQFKDAHLRSIKRQQKLFSQWRKASPEDKAAIANELRTSKQQLDAGYLAILNKRQIETFSAYCDSCCSDSTDNKSGTRFIANH